MKLILNVLKYLLQFPLALIINPKLIQDKLLKLIQIRVSFPDLILIRILINFAFGLQFHIIDETQFKSLEVT
jgi:hypothetical protein